MLSTILFNCIYFGSFKELTQFNSRGQIPAFFSLSARFRHFIRINSEVFKIDTMNTEISKLNE